MGDSPLSGVSVAWAAGGKRGMAAPTGADGQTTLEVEPGVVELRLSRRGLARAGAKVVVQQRHTRLALQMGPEQVLRGQVVDDLGKPIADASVRGLDPALPALGQWLAATDGSGHFELWELPPTLLTLELSGPAHETRMVLRRTDSQEAELVVSLARRSVVEVEVLDEGLPVPDAEVILTGPLVWPARVATTDAKGHCELSDLPGGRFQVRARLGERIAGPSEPAELTPGERVQVSLQLGDAFTIDGRTVDQAQQPLPSVQVLLRDATPGMQPRAATSDANGVFRFAGVWPGEVQLEAGAKGYAPTVESMRVPLDGPVQLRMDRGVTLTGRVETQLGNPIAGVQVWVQDEEGRRRQLDRAADGPGELGVTQGPVPLVPAVPLPQKAGGEQSVTDADGRFRLNDVAPGEARVVAHGEGYALATLALDSLEPGARRDLVLRLPQGGSVSGRVMDERGFGIGGIRVVANQPNQQPLYAMTDSRGQFHFADMAGPTVVEAQPATHAPLRCKLEIEPGKVHECELSLATAVYGLRVRVLDERGFSLGAARIGIKPRKGARGRSWSAVSGQDGTARFDELPPPPYVLSVEAAEYLPVRGRTVDDTERELNIVLQPAGAIRGRVVDSLGEPVPGARVRTEADGHQTRSNEQGEFALGELGAGDYTLSARHPSAGRGTVQVTVRARETAADVRVTLEGRLGVADSIADPKPGQAEVARGTQSEQDDNDARDDRGAQDETADPPPRQLTIAQQDKGAVITSLPRGARGLRVGDVVRRVDGEQVLSAAQARGMLRDPAGKTAKVMVKRGKRSLTVKWQRPKLR